MWFTLELIEKIMAGCKKMFSVTDYAYTVIPTYPCGQIGFVLAGKSEVSKYEPGVNGDFCHRLAAGVRCGNPFHFNIL